MASTTTGRARDPLAGYGRLYGGMAVVLLVLSFQPLFILGSGERADSLWVELGSTGHEVSVMSAMFVIALCGLLVGGAFVTTALWIPIGVGILSLLLVVVLTTRPGYSSYPDLTDWGRCGLTLGALTVLLAAAHVVQLSLRRRPRV